MHAQAHVRDGTCEVVGICTTSGADARSANHNKVFASEEYKV
jgi:hypothetical protein